MSLYKGRALAAMSHTLKVMSDRSPIFCLSRNYAKGAGPKDDAEKKSVVTVVGHAGGLGQIICYGLKFNPLIKELRLYDTGKSCPGVALDLSHIPSDVNLQVYCDPNCITDAFECTNVVVIAAGEGRKPGETREHLFEKNTKVIDQIIPAIARSSKDAHIVIATSPINSLVPYASVVMEKNGICNIKKLYGVTYVDLIRAKMLMSTQLCVPRDDINVPVVGGHTTCTILPLLSADKRGADLSEQQRADIIRMVQQSGDNVLQTKGKNAVLAPGYATAKFVHDILCAIAGKEVVTTAFIGGNCNTESPFFASPFKMDKGGIKEVLPLPKLSPDEEKRLCEIVQLIIQDVLKGLQAGKKC